MQICAYNSWIFIHSNLQFNYSISISSLLVLHNIRYLLQN